MVSREKQICLVIMQESHGLCCRVYSPHSTDVHILSYLHGCSRTLASRFPIAAASFDIKRLLPRCHCLTPPIIRHHHIKKQAHSPTHTRTGARHVQYIGEAACEDSFNRRSARRHDKRYRDRTHSLTKPTKPRAQGLVCAIASHQPAR
jgi:hypothetical protein